MFKFLFDTEQGYLKYIFKSFLLAIVIAIPVALILYTIFPNADSVDINFAKIGFYVVVIGPILETLGMLLIFKIIQIFTKDTMSICLVSAFIWAVFHSLITPLHGLVIFSTFLIYSIAFKVWEKQSVLAGFTVVLLIHMLNNLFVTMMVVYT